MNAGALDRLVQFRRATSGTDGFGQTTAWSDYGAPQWAAKTDVRDSEKWAAGQVGATLMSRFVVRWSELTSGIDAKDRLVCEGREFEIVGVKEGPGRRQWIEVTAAAGSD